MTTHAKEAMPYCCTTCRLRRIQYWRGEWRGLCQTCARAKGADVRALEAERVARKQAATARAQQQRVQDTGPRPTRERVIDNERFEVVWDGS